MFFNVNVIFKYYLLLESIQSFKCLFYFSDDTFCGKSGHYWDKYISSYHHHCVSPCTSMTNIGWLPILSLKETQELCAEQRNFQNGDEENQALDFALVFFS